MSLPRDPGFFKEMTWNKLTKKFTIFILNSQKWKLVWNFPALVSHSAKIMGQREDIHQNKQNGRWTAIWRLWLETSNQKNTWLYFQLWCSWHLHSNYPDFWKLKGGGLYLFSVCTVQSFVSTKVSKRPSAPMETWRALVPHPKDMQWMQCEEMLDTWLMYLTLW